MKAAIDIGTNTVLLLVAKLNPDNIEVIREEQRMPRLGKGVDEEGIINAEATGRVISALTDYLEILSEEFPGIGIPEVIVTATSAVRDAANRDEFMADVKKATGFSIRLLSGEEEAAWTAQGAVSALGAKAPAGDTVILDIGGGSTEIAIVKNGDIDQNISLDMGSVRFTERFLWHDPPYHEEINGCKDAIEQMLIDSKLKIKKNTQAIGVAGTLTSLAAIDLQVEHYDPEIINGHLIDSEKLYKSIDIFSLHTHEELLELSPEALKGREDIFLAGLLILEGFMKYFNLEDIIVSTGGIRHGAVING